ncbi:MAG TPA: tape measure protein, partial [Flavobacterium sp.]|nr:tape measure protein [Flavobacterium sp.]
MGKLQAEYKKLPSDFLKMQREIQAALQQQAKTEKELNNVKISTERAEQQAIQTKLKSIQLAKAEEAQKNRLIRSNIALNSAYLQLSAREREASRNLQNIIARGRTAEQTQRQYNRELRTAQKEFDTLNKKVMLADRAAGRFNRNVGNYPQKAISGLRDLMGAFGIVGGVTAFAAITKDIFNTTRELQSLDLALNQVLGSTEEAAVAQEFLGRISEAYGIELKGLTRSYISFYAAAQNSIDNGLITAKEIQQIFESVSKSAGAMGLNAEQQQGAFLALQQMISKGTIQAEEIRGQLAERLPGAFGILAKSMGVTEVQLNKLLKDGKVLAAEVLP